MMRTQIKIEFDRFVENEGTNRGLVKEGIRMGF